MTRSLGVPEAALIAALGVAALSESPEARAEEHQIEPDLAASLMCSEIGAQVCEMLENLPECTVTENTVRSESNIVTTEEVTRRELTQLIINNRPSLKERLDLVFKILAGGAILTAITVLLGKMQSKVTTTAPIDSESRTLPLHTPGREIPPTPKNFKGIKKVKSNRK